MADISERVSVFQEDFEALKKPYADIRSIERELAERDIFRQTHRTDEFTQACQQVEKVSNSIEKRESEILKPFDAWIARQTLRTGRYDRPVPTIPNRKKLLRTNFQLIDRISEGLDDGSSHVAILGRHGIDLYEARGSANLVFDKIRAQYYENSAGGHSEASPAEEGIYVRFDEGTQVTVSHPETTSTYRIGASDVVRFPVMVEKQSRRFGGALNRPTRNVDATFDPTTASQLPFVPLGSEANPLTAIQMEALFATDKHRFGLRAAAFAGGLAAWLTVERPEEAFRERVVTDVASEALLLLQKGTQFDAAMRAARVVGNARGGSRGVRIPQEERIADFSLKKVHAILHGAGVSTNDVKEKVLDSVGRQPQTMREISGQLTAHRTVEEFFDSF